MTMMGFGNQINIDRMTEDEIYNYFVNLLLNFNNSY